MTNICSDKMALIWVRAEYKEHERRTPLTPNTCKELLSQGHKVIVEKSKQRIFKDEEYKSVGCEIRNTGDWQNAPKDAIIIGIKELPDDVPTLTNTHVYFGHAYKNQTGWKELLRRFDAGGGTLLDIEFMVDNQGKRMVAAFGRMAGVAGAALGLYVWYMQKLWPSHKCPQIEPYESQDHLIATLTEKMREVSKMAGKTLFPKIIVIGALGRCGRGSVDFLEKFGIPSEHITKWDIKETEKGGPFSEILDHDIFINDIFLSSNIPPFVTLEMLDVSQRCLSVVIDVSCDCSSPFNPVPIYDSITTFENPTHRLTFGSDSPFLDIVAIDHLPSLLPRESSENYAHKLAPYLSLLPKIHEEPVWMNTLKIFKEKVNEATENDK